MRSKRLILLACASLLPASSIYASYSDAQQAAASGDIEAAIQHYIAEAANSNSPLAEASLWEAARLQLDKQKFADFTATASQFQQKYPNTEKAHWLEFWAACVPIYEGKAHVAYPQLKTLSADPKLPELATPIRDALATADEARFLAAQQAFATQNYAAVPGLANGYLVDHPEGDKALWLKFWIAASPAMQGTATSTSELDSILITGNLPADLKAQAEQIKAQAGVKIAEVRAQAELNAWESAQALLAAKSYDAFTTASLEFVREFPGTERAQLMSFWAACVPMWQGKPADSAPKLNALLTGELLDSIRESVLVELAKCQQAIADIDGYTTTAQAYREKFPKGSNLETIAFLEAQTLIATQSYSEAADKLQRFIEDWPESPNIRAASFARVQALHDARRSQDVDAACQAYLSRYPDSVEAINVKYIKMLVPLTLQRPNWDEAIDRCNLFRIENPESDFAPNAELNRGWALHEKALIAKRDSRLEEAASLQEASHLAMENFRIQARQLPSDHPQKPKRELETLDSYLHEGNMEGLAAEAARQGEVYKTDSSRFVASMLYLGIAHLKRSEPDYEAACEALLLVLNTDIIPKTYDEVLATHSAVWLLQSSMNVENISYGQAAYSYIKYSLPESPLRTQALSDFSHFDSEAQ